MPMSHAQAVAAGKKAARTRWGKRAAKKQRAGKKGRKGMSHAKAVAAGKKAARTRWGPDGKKGTPKARARAKKE